MANASARGAARRAGDAVREDHDAKSSGGGQTLALPGTLQGFVQAPIAARASGYLKRWTKDIGSRVAEGRAARRDRVARDRPAAVAGGRRAPAAAASLTLAKSTVERWEACARRTSVSQQELDERRSAAAQATRQPRRGRRQRAAPAPARGLQARRRAVRRRDHAPQRRRRRPDRCRRRPAARCSCSPRPIRCASTSTCRSRMRIWSRPGQPVVVTQAELRGQKFDGEVARTSASIDAATRTMQVEVALPNRDGALLPGAYVQVALPLAASQALAIPTNALLFRGEGTRVALVDADGRVQLRPITLGRNFGEIVRGARRRQRERPDRAEPAGLARRRRPGRARAGRRGGRGGQQRRRGAAAGREARAKAHRDAAGRLRARRRRAAAGRVRGRPGLSQACARPAGRVEGRGAVARRQARRPAPRARGGAASAIRNSTRSPSRRSPQPDAGGRRGAPGAGPRDRRRGARPALFPQLGLRRAASRQHISANRPQTNYASPNFSTVQNDIIAALAVSYEVDLAGRVQRSIEGAQASAEQSAADFENTRLVLTPISRPTTSTCARPTSSSTC